MMKKESKRQRQQKKQEDLCAICFNRKNTALIDCCEHRFCNTCIKDWVKGDAKSCPLCRRDVNVINSIRTGKVLYRVRRQIDREPSIVSEDSNFDEQEWVVEQQQEIENEPLIPQRQPSISRQPERVMYPNPIPPENLNPYPIPNLWTWLFLALGLYMLYALIFSKIDEGLQQQA